MDSIEPAHVESAHENATVHVARGNPSFARIASVLGNRHQRAVVLELAFGARRFKELERALKPITPKVLSTQLRALVELRLVARKDYAELPLRVEYRLTPLGESLRPVLKTVSRWTLAYNEACLGLEATEPLPLGKSR